MVPQTLAASDVLAIAVTADKYDFVDVLSLVSGNWLQPRKENQAGDLMLLTAAAYLFRNAMAFREITRAMILKHGGPYLALSCKAVESAMEWRVLCEYLDEQLGHVDYVTDWLMYRFVGGTKKLCKTETSGNPISRNSRHDRDVYSQVWMVKQIRICLFEITRRTGPLANALTLHL